MTVFAPHAGTDDQQTPRQKVVSDVPREDVERVKAKRVEEVMIPLHEYPQIRDSATLVESMEEMEMAQVRVSGLRSLPRLMLVMDGKDRLVGIVRRRDILRGLEPKFLRNKPMDLRKRLFDVEVDPNLLELSADLVIEGIRKRASRTVRSVMITNVVTIDHNDHFMKAIYEMVTHDVTSLPVLKDQRVIGIVRTVELFNEIAELVVA